MSFRGRGRGRFGFGGAFGHAKQLPFQLFPEIEGLGHAEYSTENVQLIKWSSSLQKYYNSSPYFYKDRNDNTGIGGQLPDIERYSDKNTEATKTKQSLWDFIRLDEGHVPAELAGGAKKGRKAAKRVKWSTESDSKDPDFIGKLLDKHERLEQHVNAKKENEEEEEEEEEGDVEEDDGEFSDEGDYEQAEYCDDDEDDFNLPEDDNDEPYF